MRGLRHCRSLLNDNIKHRNETMARETEMSQSLMSGALLHFQSGVPIKDLPMLDAYQMLRQLVKQTGSYSDAAAVTVAAQKDKMLFDFVIDHIQSGSRRQDELKVRHAAEKMIRIGLETDNVMALDKGSKRLYEVAGLDKPEDERVDMGKMSFLPPVVTTSVKDVDETKEDVDDREMKRIMAKYGGFVDEKEGNINRMVETMAAKSKGEDAAEIPQPTEQE